MTATSSSVRRRPPSSVSEATPRTSTRDGGSFTLERLRMTPIGSGEAFSSSATLSKRFHVVVAPSKSNALAVVSLFTRMYVFSESSSRSKSGEAPPSAVVSV